MCNVCNNPNCKGCPDPKLTERDRDRLGWNNQPSEEELKRLLEQAKHATEQGMSWQGWPKTGF